MKTKQILRWGILICLSIVLLSALYVLRSYLAAEVYYEQYGDLTDETQILFIGNSYTFYNDFPQMFSELAVAGGHHVSVSVLAQGGRTLQKHIQSQETIEILQKHSWDFVVLQEQSVIPSLPRDREQEMYPAVRRFVGEIDEIGGKGILFMTWGHRDGLSPAKNDDYQAMQAELKTGYLEIANELDLIVSPVGIAWQHAVQKDPQLDLWAADGSHPNRAGSYLAACVFYAVVFKESPVGLASDAGFGEEKARFLQAVAAETVLGDLELWNIE